MKKLFKNIILFLLVSIVVGEAVVRLTHTMADIPQRTIDEFGIQKYYPNQEGYWKGGKHKWNINKLGWPGELPQSFDNLIMIIGDSYIENFMNPNKCHQSSFLKSKLKNYNFMEAGRSGVSLIEAMEISKHMDSLQPIQSLIYVNNGDFYESITQIKPMSDITQLDTKTNAIKYGKMKTPGLKKVLYNWKLMYYFYNRFPLSKYLNKNHKKASKELKKEISKDNSKINQLITYIKQNYNINDKTLVFHPNSEKWIIDLCKTAGFNIILLDSSKDTTWTFDYDSHWTCYGHEKAAEQIYNALRNKSL